MKKIGQKFRFLGRSAILIIVTLMFEVDRLNRHKTKQRLNAVKDAKKSVAQEGSSQANMLVRTTNFF